jgi:hypothetical protein
VWALGSLPPPHTPSGAALSWGRMMRVRKSLLIGLTLKALGAMGARAREAVPDLLAAV